MEDNDCTLKEIIKIICVIFIGMSFMGGLAKANDTFCEYSSLIKIINIPFVIGCELAKDRF